jgi:hypothetical protein
MAAWPPSLQATAVSALRPGLSNPALSVAIGVIEATVGLTVTATALFGSDRLSERVFRLLRRIADRPAPHAAGRGWESKQWP